jgi:glycosyltransferase involved in cell wall biosynthesis
MKIRYMLLHAYGMGGTIRTVINQANAMSAAGHQAELISVDQREGVRADSVGRRAWRVIRGRIVPPGEFKAGYFTERVERAVIDYVSGLKDGILVTTRPALNLISARRTPGSVARVAQDHMNLGTYPATVRDEIARHYPRFDTVVTLTKNDQAEYRKLLPGTSVAWIPNAVHTLGQTRSRQERPLVVAAGRLVAQKGFDMLIPAFKRVVERHPDWRLRIFGTGPKKAELGSLIKDHGLSDSVTLMGRTDRLDDELAKASIYVLSSRFEGLPMVMIEAMSHALPVVAFDCPTGPADVLTDGVDGLLVPPGDVGGLAAGLDSLIADRDLRVRMGAAAATTALRYSPEVVMPMWENLFTGFTANR